MSRAERRREVVRVLREEVARALRVGPAEVGEVGEDRPLTALGLDSLAAVELEYALESAVGVSPSVEDLLGGMTLGELADAAVAALEGKEREEEEKALGKEDRRGDAGAPGPADRLTHGQRALWFLERLSPGGGAYHIVAAARVRGRLDESALRRSFAALVSRHPALRTVYPEVGGEPRARVLDQGALDFALADAAGWDDLRVGGWLAAEGYRPFDLAHGPVVRVRLLRRGADEHALLFAVHHIAADFWSLAVALRELGALYGAESAGTPAALPPVRGFGEQALREAGRLASAETEELWEWWRERLGGELPVLELPADRPRPPVQTSRGGVVSLSISPARLTALRDAGRRAGTTLFTQILASFTALLARVTGQEDLVLGTPTSGRGEAGAGDLAGVVGYFVNPVVLRADLSGDPTFAAHLERTRAATLAAFAHGSLPFPLLAERLQPVRDPSRSPVFQAMLTLLSGERLGQPGLAGFAVGQAAEPVTLGDLTLAPMALPARRAQLDLALTVAELSAGALAAFEHNADLFDRTTVARLAAGWERLVDGALADPGRRLSALPLLAPSERQQLAVEWNDTAADFPRGACLHALFFAQAERTPAAVAVVAGDEHLTYGELAARVEGLARRLRARGIGAEAVVGLCFDRGSGMIVALLAVLAAGGAFLPLDPLLPAERLGFLLGDSGARLLLTRRAVLATLPPIPCPVLCLDDAGAASEIAAIAAIAARTPPAVFPESLAYVLYTSGSTGRPKGTLVPQRAILHVLLAVRDAAFGAGRLRVAVNSSWIFDPAIEQILHLLLGNTLVIVPEEPRVSGEAMVELLARERPDLLDGTPAQVKAWLAAGLLAVGSPRHLLVGGEAMEEGTWRALAAAPEMAVWNLYGPTECAVDSTVQRVAGDRASLGRPLPRVRAYVLDGRLDPRPVGIVGELHLAGAGVSRGYLGRPELTAERFLPDPLGEEPGGRLYRTGDLVRTLADGRLDFLGRADLQVKLRGVRIEPGEIEAALAAHPGVRGAAVLAAGAGSDQRLVAFVAGEAETRTLRESLRGTLPLAMVPAAWVRLEALPLAPSGKVDRRALASLVPAAAESAREGFIPPRGEVARLLAAIWGELLDGAPAGMEDDFFARGGHSLLAARLASRVREACGVELPVADFFAAPRLAEQAARIEAALAGGGAPALLPPLPLPPVPRAGAAARSAGVPLTAAQRRLWFLAQLAPRSTAYHLPAGIRMAGPLDVRALAAALGEIVRRHESLRTAIDGAGGASGEALARVLPAAGFALPVVSLEGLGAGGAGELARLAGAEARRPFDPARGPLARFALLRQGAAEHVLLATFHHLVADGGSIEVFERELSVLYGAFAAGGASPLAEPAVQYGDYALWQARLAAGAAGTATSADAALPYWRERLAGAPRELALPFDRPAPLGSAESAARAGLLERQLSPAAVESLGRLARQAGATRFMVVAAAVAALLGRLCGMDDLLLGTPVAHRRRPELEGAIGLFVNMVALRAELARPLADPRVEELIAGMRREVLGALAHQDLPFERLVEELAPEREGGRPPLVQAVVTLEPPPLAASLPGLALSLLPRQATEAKFDLAIQVVDTGESLRAAVEYPAARFDRTTMARLLGGLDRMLAGLVIGFDTGGRLSALSPLSEAERQQTLREWNDTDPRLSRGSLAASFLAVARRSPASAALAFGGERLSYGELAHRGLGLARRLRRLGVGPESIVGLASERSVERIVGLLGIVLAGGAYLPLDPAYPDERLELLVADAGARAIVTHDGLWRGSAPGLAVVDLSELEREGDVSAAGAADERWTSRWTSRRSRSRRASPAWSTPPARRGGRRGWR